jgi:hypothetical protein
MNVNEIVVSIIWGQRNTMENMKQLGHIVWRMSQKCVGSELMMDHNLDMAQKLFDSAHDDLDILKSYECYLKANNIALYEMVNANIIQMDRVSPKLKALLREEENEAEHAFQTAYEAYRKGHYEQE